VETKLHDIFNGAVKKIRPYKARKAMEKGEKKHTDGKIANCSVVGMGDRNARAM